MAAIVMCTAIASCAPVSAGYVGVQTTFGKVSKEPLEPGIHFVLPFIQRVTQLETRLKPFVVKVQASSKDLQVISSEISAQHSLNPKIAPEGLRP